MKKIRAVVRHIRVQASTVGVLLGVTIVVGCFLQPHQHVQQRILILRVTGSTRFQPNVIGRDLPQLRHGRGTDGPRVRFTDVRAGINPCTTATTVQLNALTDGIHQVRCEMVVPDVREPNLRIG
uniref:Uncharacterized protein n=1 Tax=Anopheles farauti TaxID=69004 RepID=A0A182QBT4_9DIPT